MADQKGLSYDPVQIPKPVTNHDYYLYASLVEARALRKTLEELIELLKAQPVKPSAPVSVSAQSKNK